MNRYLLYTGDVTDPSTHGGLSFCLLQAGLTNGLLQGGLALHPDRLKRRRILWNFAQLFYSGYAGGYQTAEHSTAFN